MNTPQDQLLFLSSPASVSGIFSPIQSASTSKPASRSRDNPRKRRSKFIPIRLPLSLDHSNYDVGAASRPRKISRKPDPNAPKITRPCSECGKKFWSWKALFGHMRCHPERQWRGMNPPVNFHAHQPEVSDSFSGMGLRPGPALTEEDHEVAACLVMLANSRAAGEGTDHDHDHNAASISNHESEKVPDPELTDDPCSHHLMGRFECSSCKKVFGSPQALGGHRASHKNVKGCFANALTRDSNVECCRDITVSDSNNRKSEFREGSWPTRLMMESYTAVAKETCDIDLSLRLGL